MQDKARNNLYIEMMNQIDKGFDLMTEYDSITHTYGNVKL